MTQLVKDEIGKMDYSKHYEYTGLGVVMDHMGHDVYQTHQGHGLEDQEDVRLMDEMETGEYPFQDEEELEIGPTRAVHQCNICNKIFVSFKGLQQHSVIHTDQKPFQCDICGKTFRFKSNLFEHRSVHTGFTPHACPYCGKTCRLKGNLKKHLKTHVSTKEELEQAWRPFASNRRPPADIPDDAIIVRGSGEPFFTPPTRTRKRKLGLGTDPRGWVEKIRRGEILPCQPMEDKLRKLEEAFKTPHSENMPINEILEYARNIGYEKYDCPLCKAAFLGRTDCVDHIDVEHPMARLERPLFCEVCLKTFADRKSFEQHDSYHKRVSILLQQQENQEQEFSILEQSRMQQSSHDNGEGVSIPLKKPGLTLDEKLVERNECSPLIITKFQNWKRAKLSMAL
ncbi:unnamed protein product [Auanema sp. JU1783]|nr:unnamed protein product [Auanema sp. JU1783]